MSGDVGKAEVAALEFVNQFFVIHTHEVQHRGMKIVNMYRAVEDVVAVFIGEAVSDTALDASTCEPNAETAGMMIPTIMIA